MPSYSSFVGEYIKIYQVIKVKFIK